MNADDSASDRDRAAALEALRRHSRFLIASHIRADGDSVGSEVALAAVLRALGKSARVVKSDAVPPRYAFLRRGWVHEAVRPRATLRADCVIVLDCPERDRVGPLVSHLPGPDRARWISIDHHLGHTGFAHVNWVDPAACSVGEMLYDGLIRAGGLPLPPLARDGIYVAIMTDTGQFGHGNTSARALRIAAELVDEGANAAELCARVYRSKTKTELELERRARNRLEFSTPPRAGRVAWVSLSRRDFRAAAAGPEHIQEIVEIPRAVAGVEVAVLFYEPPGLRGTKVSLRGGAAPAGRGRFDVRAVAAHFEGGGHRNAAGCELELPLARARQVVLKEIFRRLR